MRSPYIQGRGIVVIDDDETFGKAITHVGLANKIPVSYFESLEDLGSLALLGEYDAVVLDFYLGEMDGIEIARYIDVFFPGLPAILTSGQAYIATEDQDVPRCIKNFILKACGIENILAAALRAIKERRRSAPSSSVAAS